MASYGFSTITNVLPLGVERAYVPRTSRPHLAWAATASSSALGEHCRLKGDGTAARETLAGEGKREKNKEELDAEVTAPSSSSRASATPSTEVMLRALLTTDGATGTQLTLFHDATASNVPVCSSAMPSRRRVVALWSPTSASDEDDGCIERLLNGEVPLYVSDEIGNVFLHRWSVYDSNSEPSTKRHRGEQRDTANGADAWTLIAVAQSHLPSNAPAAAASSLTSSSLASLFAVTRGAPGWAGLTALQTDSCSSAGAQQLISAREFYQDVRVIDVTQHEVVRAYSTTHPPTGLLCPAVQAAPHCVLVTEGCLATLFDVRCRSAVLSLGEIFAAQAEWTVTREAAAAEEAQQQQQDTRDTSTNIAAGKGWHDHAGESSGSNAKASLQLSPLVPGRLTSTMGQVRDICNTANPYEVACAVDRALCVYDLRKFSRLFTSSSVLKYVIGGVTSVAGGRGVVCTGIDSEVRLVPLYETTGTDLAGSAEALSLAARAVVQLQKKKQRIDATKKTEEGSPVFDMETMGPGGTFRTRLNTSVSCTSVWQGGWVSTQNLAGVAAVGVSVDGEVFLAK